VPGTSHAARSSSSHRAPATRSLSRTPTFNDDKDDDDDAQGNEQEELGASQLDDALSTTQPTQRRCQPPRRHTPGTDALGKAQGKRKAKGVDLGDLWS
jgi:hypothetical protein